MRSSMQPYLLPLDHVMKVPLDFIFSKARAIENEATFSKAGFVTLFSQPTTYIKVAKHPLLPKFLVKVYLDSEQREKEGKPGWLWFVQRCVGAENIRRLIKKKKLQYFSVPQKWLYLLPVKSAFSHKNHPAILLVEDMDLTNFAETEDFWRNRVTHKHLDELYCIISHGFSSTYLLANIPYCRNGKLACVDTEHPKRKPNYKMACQYLSDEMRSYWEHLVRKGGKH